MYCKYCGKRIDEDDLFCPHCGSFIGRTEKGDKTDKKTNYCAIIGFYISLLAELYINGYVYLLFDVSAVVAFTLSFVGLVVSCAGMMKTEFGGGWFAFFGFLLGADALFGCGVIWLNFDGIYWEMIRRRLRLLLS